MTSIRYALLSSFSCVAAARPMRPRVAQNSTESGCFACCCTFSAVHHLEQAAPVGVLHGDPALLGAPRSRRHHPPALDQRHPIRSACFLLLAGAPPRALSWLPSVCARAVPVPVSALLLVLLLSCSLRARADLSPIPFVVRRDPVGGRRQVRLDGRRSRSRRRGGSSLTALSLSFPPSWLALGSMPLPCWLLRLHSSDLLA